MEATLEIQSVRPLQDLTVLVVEDQYLIALEAQGMVEEAGAARVLLAKSIKEALSLCQSEAVDIAVLDLLLSEGTTEPLMEQLRRRGIPFVVASGYEMSGEPKVTAPVVRKPYLAVDLLAALTVAIRTR